MRLKAVYLDNTFYEFRKGHLLFICGSTNKQYIIIEVIGMIAYMYHMGVICMYIFHKNSITLCVSINLDVT